MDVFLNRPVFHTVAEAHFWPLKKGETGLREVEAGLTEDVYCALRPQKSKLAHRKRGLKRIETILVKSFKRGHI